MSINIDKITWYEFEELCLKLLENNNIKLESTKKGKDGGIDIIGYYDFGMIKGKIIIQCKYFSIKNKVSVNVVRELNGLISAHHATHGIVITTSYFTKEAEKFADENNIRLINRDSLLNILDSKKIDFKFKTGIKDEEYDWDSHLLKLINDKKIDEALKYCFTKIELDRKNSKYWLWLGDVYKEAKIFRKSYSEEELIKILKEYEKVTNVEEEIKLDKKYDSEIIFPSDPEPDKSYDEKIENAYYTAISLDPKNKYAYIRLSYNMRYSSEERFNLILDALKYNPYDEDLFTELVDLALYSKYDKSRIPICLKYIDNFLKKYPNNPLINFYAGKLHLKNNNLIESNKFLNKCIALNIDYKEKVERLKLENEIEKKEIQFMLKE